METAQRRTNGGGSLGTRDLENGTIEVARRDTLTKETISIENVVEDVEILLEHIN